MSSAIKVAALGVLLAFVAGCRHKKQPILPRQTQAPVVTAAPPSSSPELPTVPAPEAPNVSEAKPEAPHPKPKHKRRKTTPTKTESPAETHTETVPAQAPAVPPSNSPIGQLSTGSDQAGAESRAETVELINSTEKGLDGLTRPLSTEEQETVTQIRAFLVKARGALTANDLDGAHTLATKARVLLDELTKE